MAFEDLHRPLGAAGFQGAVRGVIIMSGVMLVLQQFWGGALAGTLGLVPARVAGQGWVWQPLTYVFLHGGIFHWLFNMFIFWMFGRELEVRWGTGRFIRFCMVTALGAAGCVLLFAPGSMIPTIGSSGIVFGLLGAFALMFPQSTMYLYFLIPLKIWQVAVIFGLIELFAMAGPGRGPAPLAHLGGMAAGFLYVKLGSRWSVGAGLKAPWIWLGRVLSKKSKRPAVPLEVVTDDLAAEVDRLLEKILKHGVDSLTPKEKAIMDRYARKKR